MIEARADAIARDVSDPRTLKWLGLALTPGIGAARGRKLAELFNGVDRIFSATLTELEAVGLPAAAAQNIALGKSSDLASEELDRVKALGARVVAQDDPDYPKRLYEIYDPPLVVYVRGSSEIINKYGLAVVGTRHPTPYGVGMAERLACDLAAHGLIIVSGMARGVDAAAHRGALNAHGQTVAIWGTGVDVTPTPRRTRSLQTRFWPLGVQSLASSHWARFPLRKTFRFATELSAESLLACS
jgi:DNA processing protein